MWAVIGLGPNNVEIPCLWFKNHDIARLYLKTHFGEPTGENFWDVNLEGKAKQKLAKALFTNYYPGCGECYRVELKFVEEGTPFVGWDLD